MSLRRWQRFVVCVRKLGVASVVNVCAQVRAATAQEKLYIYIAIGKSCIRDG